MELFRLTNELFVFLDVSLKEMPENDKILMFSNETLKVLSK